MKYHPVLYTLTLVIVHAWWIVSHRICDTGFQEENQDLSIEQGSLCI